MLSRVVTHTIFDLVAEPCFVSLMVLLCIDGSGTFVFLNVVQYPRHAPRTCDQVDRAQQADANRQSNSDASDGPDRSEEAVDNVADEETFFCLLHM